MKTLIKLLLAAAAIWFVTAELDVSQFRDALAGVEAGKVALMMLLLCVCVVNLGIRLRTILACSRLGTPLEASFLALGFNNLLPAKMGELMKIEFLARQLDRPRTETLNAVFWERFGDLNLVLVIAVAAAVLSGEALLSVPMALGVCGVWAGLLLLAHSGELGEKLLWRLPAAARIAPPLLQLRALMVGSLSAPFLGRLAGLSAIQWILYGVVMALNLNWLGGFGLDAAACLTVFAFSLIAAAVPALPASIGTYEASIVFALGLYGIGREEALAIALVAHAIQIIPTTIGGLVVFLARRI